MNVEEFYRFLGFEPYRHQEEAYDKILSLADDGGCVVIKAPTATGKTEAAVASYFAGVKDCSYPFAKLIYVLPTRALANAQRQRLEERIAKKLRLNLKIVVDLAPEFFMREEIDDSDLRILRLVGEAGGGQAGRLRSGNRQVKNHHLQDTQETRGEWLPKCGKGGEGG